MSDNALSLFDDESAPVSLEQAVFDYRLLSTEKREFVLLRTDETQILLKRTTEHIIQIGKNLLEVKERLPHGMFGLWLRSEFGMSDETALNFMRVAKRFEGKIQTVWNLSVSALYLLASPSSSQEAVDEAFHRAEAGEKITKNLAKQIIDEQEARKRAEDELSKLQANIILNRELAQQQFFQIQSEAEAQVAALTQQLNSLQEEMKTLTKPDEIIVEKVPEDTIKELESLQSKINTLNASLETQKKVTPPEVQAKLTQLQQQMAALQEQRKQQEALVNTQKEHIEKLNNDINTAIRKREFVENEDRIRQGWRLITSETHSCLMRLLGQWPTPIDAQAFDADDWARVDHLQSTLRRVLDECGNLRHSGQAAIIDDNVSPYALSLNGHFVDAEMRDTN